MALASTTPAFAQLSVEPLHNHTVTNQKIASQTMADDHTDIQADKHTVETDTLAKAVARNDISTVKALIKNEADLRPANWYDTPVLVTAAQQGFFEIVQLLVSARANVNTGYDRLPLHSAAENGHLSVIHYLLSAGAYPEAQDSRGYTALVAAAATGQLAIVQCLLSHIRRASSTEIEQAMSLAAQGRHQAVCAYLQSMFLPQQPSQSKPEVTTQNDVTNNHKTMYQPQ